MLTYGYQLNRDQGFISHVIMNIDAILMKPGMSELLRENALKLNIACSFVNCLLVALKGKLPIFVL